MRVEYNSVLSTPIEADNIGRLGRYRYISKTQISVDISVRPVYWSISTKNGTNKNISKCKTAKKPTPN